MRWLALSLLVLAAPGCEEPKPAPKATESKPAAPATKPAPPPKPKPKEAEPPAPPKALTFDEAFAAALELGAKLDEEEPAQTEKAKKVLTRDELEQLRTVDMPNFDSRFGDAATASKLAGLGLRAWVERVSRRQAAGDATFKGVVRAIWDPKGGAAGLLGAMNVWWTLDPDVRRDLARFGTESPAAAKRDPKVRDAVLLLGGGAWLAR